MAWGMPPFGGAPVAPPKPKVPIKPNPVEGGGGFKFGMQGQGQQLGFGVPVGYNPLFGQQNGGGLAGALQQQFEQSGKDFYGAMGQSLAPNDPKFGAFGAFLQNMAMNPQGFGSDIGRRQLTRLAERQAGVTGQRERDLANSGGRNFASFGDMLQNIRGQGAQELSAAELDFLMQEAGLRQAQTQTGVSGGLTLAQILAAQAAQKGEFEAGRARPLTEGGDQPATGPGGKYDLLNENGEIMPFGEDGRPLSAFDLERARQQRMAWMSEFGGGA